MPSTQLAMPEDLEAIKSIAIETELFTSDEVGFFDEVFAGFLDGSLEGHAWITGKTDQGSIGGAAYYAPEPFSDRVWNLYFLGVSPNEQGHGFGALLVAAVESALKVKGEAEARVLLVETSGVVGFEPTRAFYRAQGFSEEARIREFYGPGDDKIVFWKSLLS